MRVSSSPRRRLEELLGERVREKRELLGWTQAELTRRLTAAGTRMHQPTIARIELGVRAIRVDELQALADVFDVQPADLIATEPSVIAAASDRVQRLRIKLMAEERQRVAAVTMMETADAMVRETRDELTEAEVELEYLLDPSGPDPAEAKYGWLTATDDDSGGDGQPGEET